MDVPANLLEEKDNELFVLADNRFNATTAPMHTGGDFWHYGGLTRSVELHTMGNSANPVLWRAYATPSGADATKESKSAPDSIDLTLQLSDTMYSGELHYSLDFDGSEAKQVQRGTAKDGQVVLAGVKVPNPKAWSPSEPNLHTVTVRTYFPSANAVQGNGALEDAGSVTERFGLRTFGTDKKSARVTVNGKVVKLVGWNHHTQWPVTAASPTDSQMDADIALLKKGNANYVRGAHYPHDPRMMDRFDEAGIMFWSETLGPSVSTENTLDPRFMKYQLQQLAEMLDNAMNHASVFTWGWFNEGPSNDPKACPGYGACARYAQTRDPSRFTTWADNKKDGGVCYEHATLIAYNDYPGWYDHSGDKAAPVTWWNKYMNDIRAGNTSSGPSGTLGKPMVISETGAGGIFEWSDNSTDAKWTLKYQAEIIGSDVDVALANDNVSGITLWHFYDFKVDNCGSQWPCRCHGSSCGQENNTHCPYSHPPPTTFAELATVGPPNCTTIVVNSRPGGENHKGSLDFWRRPKPAFWEVAAKYKGAN